MQNLEIVRNFYMQIPFLLNEFQRNSLIVKWFLPHKTPGNEFKHRKTNLGLLQSLGLEF